MEHWVEPLAAPVEAEEASGVAIPANQVHHLWLEGHDGSFGLILILKTGMLTLFNITAIIKWESMGGLNVGNSFKQLFKFERDLALIATQLDPLP